MQLETIKFGRILFDDQRFSLCEVIVDQPNGEFVAITANCLRLRRIIPSISLKIKEISDNIANMTSGEGHLALIIDSGITPDLNPFLVIEKPKGVQLSLFRFTEVSQLITILRQLSSCLHALHATGIYQRDLDPNWDVFFDGETLTLTFPAAREMFHKAYLDTDDNATVFDIPRFVLTAGSVYEDVSSFLKMMQLIALNLDLPLRDKLEKYLNEKRIILESEVYFPSKLLEEITNVRQEDIDVFSSEPIVPSGSTEGRENVSPKHYLKYLTSYRPKVLLPIILISLLVFAVFMGRKPEEAVLENGLAELSNFRETLGKEGINAGEDQLDINNLEPQKNVLMQMEEPPELPPIPRGKEEIIGVDHETGEMPNKESMATELGVDYLNLVMKAESNNFEERISALKEVIKICEQQNEDYEELVKKLLKDPDVLVRGYAVHAYAECFPKQSKDVLLKMLELEESDLVKMSISKILKK